MINHISQENLALVLAITKRLYSMYDSGGHSCGRSRRSHLLEMLMDELHFSDISSNLADNMESFCSMDIATISTISAPSYFVGIQLELNFSEKGDTVEHLTHAVSEHFFIILLVIKLKKAVSAIDVPSHIETTLVDTLYKILIPIDLTPGYIELLMQAYSLEDMVISFYTRQHHMRNRYTYEATLV